MSNLPKLVNVDDIRPSTHKSVIKNAVISRRIAILDFMKKSEHFRDISFPDVSGKICDMDQSCHLVVYPKYIDVVGGGYATSVPTKIYSWNRYFQDDCWNEADKDLYPPFTIHVYEEMVEAFEKTFRGYITTGIDEEGIGTNVLVFDNLLHYTMIVKNAGPSFSDILQKNIPFIDRWTILDTGSEDNTIETIRNAMSEEIGNLYEEPFVDFQVSRNRCFDLAWEDSLECIFTVQLDDTYYLAGQVRELLTFHRNDPDFDSFHIYIRCSEGEYASNRICKTKSRLYYIFGIHEVIQNYDNVLKDVESDLVNIVDVPSEYMKERTQARKLPDIELLEREIAKDPLQPRHYFYMAQTYMSLEKYDKVVEYYLKRIELNGILSDAQAGNREEVTEALYNCGLLGDQHLGWPWEKCEFYLTWCHNHEPRKPDALYYIGYHYLYESMVAKVKGTLVKEDRDKLRRKAFDLLLKAFKIGNPRIFNLFVRDREIYNKKLPLVIAPMCYEYGEYKTGLEACERYIAANNEPIDPKEGFLGATAEQMLSWQNIYHLLGHSCDYQVIPNNKKNDLSLNPNKKPIILFVADGGFSQWNGDTINKRGLGGSETYIVEMARNMAKFQKIFDVYVFCRCGKDGEDEFDGVHYRELGYYVKFLHENLIHAAIISRYSHYLPITVKMGINNIWFILHDLGHNGNVLLETGKYKILTMSPWHKKFYLSHFPQLEPFTDSFPNGINISDFSETTDKKKFSFIYSSYPDRGLFYLLQMFPFIKQIYPEAHLDIFCDLEGEFVNNRVPEQMAEIRKLVAQMSAAGYVTNHGFVEKKVLNSYWRSADVWLYPCTWPETFCITALEAAASKTLAITNDLGALVDTVGDRGVMIPGNVTEKEWLAKLLQKLSHYYDPKNEEYYENLLDRNYKYAQEHDWNKLAKRFYETEILSLDYAGMLNWSKDIPKGSREIFVSALSQFRDIENPRLLEIGTYTGTSIITALSLLPKATGVVIDTWKDYAENESLTANLQEQEIKARFYQNCRIAGVEDRVEIHQGDSKLKLLEFLGNDQKEFDFIYVDGSHKCLDCYTDMVLSFPLLKTGGIMAIDDYMWTPENNNNVLDKPMEGVNHFFREYVGKIKILSVGYRVFIQKTVL